MNNQSKPNKEMQRKYRAMIQALERLSSVTWFDIGLFFDRLNENRKLPSPPKFTERNILKQIQRGIAFCTFDYGIDGVTIEIGKYAEALEKLIYRETGKKPKLYWLAQLIKEESKAIIKPRWKTHVIEGAGGFVDWDGYVECFKTKFARGSKTYNDLIQKIWVQTMDLVKQIGTFVVEKDIHLLFPVNACSNPGNIPYALSLILVSEYLQIPVFNSNHDFYWEDGAPAWEREKQGKKGVRDHFFINADIGEVFSFIENFFPWNSPLWFQAVLNNTQFTKLINHFGFCPANVSAIPTAVETKKFHPIRENHRFSTLRRLQLLFTGSKDNKKSRAAKKFFKMPVDWLETPYTILLGAKDGTSYDLQKNNLLLLQPTRILRRKRIEFNFLLIEALLNYPDFQMLLKSFPKLTITLMITGPVTTEHIPYIEEIIRKYSDMISRIKRKYRDRVFLALRFGIESNDSFEKMKLAPLGIHEIFSIASLVVLPSKDEGRGLPIIEASACGVPILASRYHPVEVFEEVIGASLEAGLRLHTIEFPYEAEFKEDLLKQLTNYFTNPHYLHEELEHNRSVIKKRFSGDALIHSFEKNFAVIAQNLKRDSSITDSVKKAFNIYNKGTKFGKGFEALTLSKNRMYLPGVTKLENMVYLKSLIDPSFFRMEEKYLFGRIFNYAYTTIQDAVKSSGISEKKQLQLYRRIQYVFEFYKGTKNLIVDHSLSYRHRHSKNYPFRALTECELRGIVGILLREIFSDGFYLPPPKSSFKNLFIDQPINVKALVGTNKIGIDNSKILERDLKTSTPFAWFPGASFLIESIILVEGVLLFRLGKKMDEILTEETLESLDPEKTGTVTLFVRNKYSGGHSVSARYVDTWIKNSASVNTKLLYKKGFFRIVKTHGISDGTHLAQLGPRAETALLDIKNKGGFIVSMGYNNLLTFDLLDMSRFHIGIAPDLLIGNFMGLKKGQGYILWVPAGLRPSLSYPTPVQSPKGFGDLFKSELYKKSCTMHGENSVLETLREDADRYGTPAKEVLTKLVEDKSSSKVSQPLSYVESKHLVGRQADGSPWSGAYAKVSFQDTKKKKEVCFTSTFSKSRTDTVFSIIKQFKKGKVVLAWNGGYILNPELVGKLGLPEDYIGSPLGLLICEGKTLSVPLYNKPALAFNGEGTPSIKEANLFDGLEISTLKGIAIAFPPSDRNNSSNVHGYYDLLYPEDTIPADGRVIYRFSGNRIIEILSDVSGSVPILPVGLTVSIKKGYEPGDWKVGNQMKFSLPGWEDIPNAVEAGPRLRRDGKEAIEMENGGWKTAASIKTQAARIDYIHMRGPKIGVGISKEGELIVVAVNGRLRESVGVTHSELSSILGDLGAFEAMGFDPGGSVTLIVNNKQLNISPYNKDYLSNPYCLPPEARFVGNAVLGYLA